MGWVVDPTKRLHGEYGYIAVIMVTTFVGVGFKEDKVVIIDRDLGSEFKERCVI